MDVRAEHASLTEPTIDRSRPTTVSATTPRQRGIAAFTTHLSDALAATLPDVDSFVLAANDAGHRHTYPSRVPFEIARSKHDMRDHCAKVPKPHDVGS